MDSGQRVVGVEALLRWKHSLRGLASPIEFFRRQRGYGLNIDVIAEGVETQVQR